MISLNLAKHFKWIDSPSLSRVIIQVSAPIKTQIRFVKVTLADHWSSVKSSPITASIYFPLFYFNPVIENQCSFPGCSEFYKTRRLGRVKLRQQRLPDATGAAARRGQDPGGGPLRDVVIDLRPWEKHTKSPILQLWAFLLNKHNAFGFIPAYLTG